MLPLRRCCLLAAMTFGIHAQPLTFTTFAGPGGGPGSTDGIGGAARFNNIEGVATDSNGNVYVADLAGNTIRKITPAGVVTTLAGSAGLSGSVDGIGGAARFRVPIGVATDKSGNVYVADGENGTIRKITPAGAVTTFAGSAGEAGSADGTGSAARFAYPRGVATDSAGNVYVGDTGNNTIRKITPAGVVTTLAGSATTIPGSNDGIGSAARFNVPIGVAADSFGNVYVGDVGNVTIRKITPAGVVTTLAGSAGEAGSADGTGNAARFVYPYGVATDNAANVYVADAGNSTIRKITPAGVVATLAGAARSRGNSDGTGSAARFNGPAAVATDKNGNVYVAELFNSAVRKVTPAGVVTTLAGSAAEGGSADGTGSDARFGDGFSADLLGGPLGVATDTARNVYVADKFNHTIRKVTPAGVVTTLAGLAGVSGSEDGTGSVARFHDPVGVATDNAGNVYVADQGNSTIRKITPAGVVTTIAGSAGLRGSDDGTGSAARLRSPYGVAADTGANLYVAESVDNTIRKITPAGVVTTIAGSPGTFGSADGTGSAARFGEPQGVATDKSGNIYVADGFNHTIRKITPAGVVTTIAGSPGTFGSADGTGSAARFSLPNGVATDGAGNVYVGDMQNNEIRRITPAGVVTTLAGSQLFGAEDGTGSVARFNYPAGVAVDDAGNVYVADQDNHKIRIGRPALADEATIDLPIGIIGTPRQLDTFPQTATSWQWRVIRQPAGSGNALSSVSIRNPLFTPDVADLYVFQLTASDGVKTSITTVSLAAMETPAEPGPRRRAARH